MPGSASGSTTLPLPRALKANNVAGSGGLPVFTLPSGGDPVGGVVTIPASNVETENLRSVNLKDLVASGSTSGSDDGYAAWTIEARVAGSGLSPFQVIWMGTDGGIRRIQVMITAGGIVISTESRNAPYAYGDRQLSIPPEVISARAPGKGLPADGAYHKYRLARKSYVTTAAEGWKIANPELLFDFWYDDVKIPLKMPSDIGVLWANGSTYLSNVPITNANNYNTLRLGPNWRFATGVVSTVDYVRVKNGITYADPNLLVPQHSTDGYFQTSIGVNLTKSYYYATSVFPSRGGTNVLACGIVKPLSSFAAATGGVVGSASGSAMTAPWTATNVTNSNANMVELLTVGNLDAAGYYVSVWVWRGGRILMFTGNAYTETADVVVDTNEFVLGVHLTPTAPILYINGALPQMTSLGWRTMANVSPATNTVAQLSNTLTERGIYLGYRQSSSTAINTGFKNWRFVDTLAAGGGTPAMSADQITNTQMFRYANEYDSQPLEVTYGFRIDDDETLQFVKTQGSATTSTLLGKPLPASDDASGTSLTGNVLGTLTDTSLDVVLSLANKVDTSTTTSVSQLAATSATPGTQPFVAPTDEWVLWDTTLFQNVYFVWVTTVSNNATNTNYLLKLSLYVELQEYFWMDGGMYMIVPYNAELLQYTGLVEDGIRGVVLSDYPNKNKLYFNSVNVPRRTASALGTREVVHLVDLNFAVRSGQFPSDPALMGLQNVGWPNIVSSVVDEFAKTRGYGSMFEPQNLPCRVVTSAQWPSFSASTNWKSVGRYDYFTVTP
eukprot:jgi/Mesvir1/29792/Mv19488-RA.1